jgi:protein-disulfide isomerase
MRPSLVNRLALIAAISIASAACSRADGHTSSTPERTSAKSPATDIATAGNAATDSLSVAADTSRILGSPTAKVWVIEVSDFQCPFCKQWHDETYPTVLDDYVKSGKVRLAYVNFPLNIHPHARAAATAAMCAGAQGHFWPMHDALIATQNEWAGVKDPGPVFDSLATSLHVNVSAYHACLSDPSIAALIDGDQDRAQRGGVGSTPSFWIGSKLVEGAVPPSEMRREIDQALAAAK